MDIISIGDRIIQWLLDRNAKRTKQIEEYISCIQKTCKELMEVNDPKSDKAIYLHEQLKVLYRKASTKLPPNFIETEGGTLFRALSSARIYYWLRIVRQADDAELKELFSDRKKISTSFERLAYLLHEATDNEDDVVDIKKLDIERVRNICMNDIAELTTLKPFSA